MENNFQFLFRELHLFSLYFKAGYLVLSESSKVFHKVPFMMK